MNPNTLVYCLPGCHTVTQSAVSPEIQHEYSNGICLTSITILSFRFWLCDQPDHGGPNNVEDCVELHHCGHTGYGLNPVQPGWNDAPLWSPAALTVWERSMFKSKSIMSCVCTCKWLYMLLHGAKWRNSYLKQFWIKTDCHNNTIYNEKKLEYGKMK